MELTPKVPKVPEGGEQPISSAADDVDSDGKSSFSVVGEAGEKAPERSSSSRAKPSYHKADDSMLKEGEAWAAKVHESITQGEASSHEVHADGTDGTLAEAKSSAKPASHHSAPRATHAEDADTEVAVKKLKTEAEASPAPEAQAEAEAAPEFDSGIPERHPAGTAPAPETAWNGEASEAKAPALETEQLKTAAKKLATETETSVNVASATKKKAKEFIPTEAEQLNHDEVKPSRPSVAVATTREQAESESLAAEAMAAEVAAEATEKSLATTEASVKRTDAEAVQQAEQAEQAEQATAVEQVEQGQRIVNGKKVGHSAEVKARMDEYTALNNGDANDHLHGARSAVKESAASTSAAVTTSFEP